MAIFQFRLAKLLDLREHERLAARQALADGQRHRDQLQALVAQLNDHRIAIVDNCRRLSRSGAIDLQALRAAYDHDARIKAEIATEEVRLAALDEEVAYRRQAVVASDREVRILEKLRDR